MRDKQPEDLGWRCIAEIDFEKDTTLEELAIKLQEHVAKYGDCRVQSHACENDDGDCNGGWIDILRKETEEELRWRQAAWFKRQMKDKKKVAMLDVGRYQRLKKKFKGTEYE